MQTPELAPWVRLAASHAVPGYVHGLRQPALRVTLEVAAAAAQPGPAHASHFASAPTWSGCTPLPGASVLRSESTPLTAYPAWLAWLAEGLMRLQLSAGWLVHEAAVVERWQPLPGQAGGVQAVVLVPGPMPVVLSALLPGVLRALNQRFHALAEPTQADLDLWLKALARWAPSGTNNAPLLRAAGAMGIPLLALPGGVFQLGWGRRSRLFKSSITDSTAALATAWAKDKGATNALFRMAGLPVPAQRAVASLDAALQAARQLGYPVVLKPVNLDQGVGVEADLRDEAELRAAYSRSVQHGSSLVLEQHVRGEDYRVYTVNGELMAVGHRIPARVVGDGVATVAQLVVQANEHRLQLDPLGTLYKPIELDTEALDMLGREGLDLHAVLPVGKVMRLRRSANMSRGGMAVDVTDHVHPDNVDLCLRASALLRLDIAGLDLLIPDIARSWREVGAAFCEANAQPQMGGHVHPWIFERILRRYVTARGRVPAVLVLGPSGEPVLGHAVAQALARAGWPAAVVQGRGAELIERTRAAVMQPALGAVVVQTDGVGIAQFGLPLDAFDVLVVSGWALPAQQQAPALAWLARHVSGVVVWDKASAIPRHVLAAGRVTESWQLLERWAAAEPPLMGRDTTPMKRLQRVAVSQALPDAVLRCVRALHSA